MAELARDVAVGASPGFAAPARRRRSALPPWLRLIVVLAVAAGLWAFIILAFRALFAG
jgi:hypothetical protein